MDSLISSALEEICYHDSTGVSLTSLWSKLYLAHHSPNSLKSSLWTNLLSIPSLQFTIISAEKNRETPSIISPDDPKIQCFEDAEKLNLKIVAKYNLKNSFLGLYHDNISEGDPKNPLLLALRRIAHSRARGILQSELAKELGIFHNNFFRVVRTLECLGLIVKQPVVVKKETNVVTNMLYLYRYAKHLGVKQSPDEISEQETDLLGTSSSRQNTFAAGDQSKASEDNVVVVKDYVPAMEAICAKLEEAKDNVLVVSDIKRDLGYSGNKGKRRTWSTVCGRLKQASVVEEFKAKVNGKVECCFRLLKRFSPKNFESKTRCYGDDCDRQEQVKFGRTVRQTEQLVELPLDFQIYEIIDSEGTKGATSVEVSRRLGLDKKRNCIRSENLASRFGMHRQAESCNKTRAYRVWTSGNSNAKAPNAFPGESKFVLGENKIPNLDVGNLGVPGKFAEHLLALTTEVNIATSGKLNRLETDNKFSHGFLEDGKTNHMHLSPGNVPELLHKPCHTASTTELELMRIEMETNVAPPNSGPCEAHPSVSFTADSTLRAKRILERLKEEKFILTAELQRWLMSLEEEKCTKMDKKTVERILKKLEKHGHCKIIDIKFPSVTNCSSNRSAKVVLHSSVQSFPPELQGAIHDKLRCFERKIRGQGSSKWKTNEAVPVLNGVTRTQIRVNSDEKGMKPTLSNGFILGKMARARLLHIFVWNYIHSSPGWIDDISSGTDSCSYKLFSLEEVIKAIPIELFLQVSGSPQKHDDMVEKCKKGLCLSDLPVEEYRRLMDTRATGKLSLIIDILQKLKLIQLVPEVQSKDGVEILQATYRHTMELKSYVEEPPSIVAFGNLRTIALQPRIIHDFFLSSREAVDEYWKTLEYCYSAADQIAAKQAFPGSVVQEVFRHQSWTSAQITSPDQHAGLLKRLVKDDLKKKLSYGECDKIAKDLNLSIQQVLHIYYKKDHLSPNRFEGVLNVNKCQRPIKKQLASSMKRKKPSESSSIKRLRVDSVNEEAAKEDLASSGEHDDNLPGQQEDNHLETVEKTGPNEGVECYSTISQDAFAKVQPTRQSRFLWTDEADRQLVIQYIKHRAVLGAKIQLDWNTLPDLPAPPKICKRRMASLKENTIFREAVMKLCTMVGERYAKYLEKAQNISLLINNPRVLTRCSTWEIPDRKFSDNVKCGEGGFEEERWDDFDDRNIKKALEDLLRYKRISKLGGSQKVRSFPKDRSYLNTNVEGYKPMKSALISSSSNEVMQNDGPEKNADSAGGPRLHPLHNKFLVLSRKAQETSVSRQVHKSLAVSNAVELLKVDFLSNSKAKQQIVLAETVRHYSKDNIFEAFSYLKEKKIMIGGNGGEPFRLSRKFLNSVSESPFPANTGKRAAKLFSWLHERDKDLVEGRVDLTADLHCGDIFQLFALVSSGELSVSTNMPDIGVGETCNRSLKRKAKEVESCYGDKAKKFKSSASSELFSRQEKGFPGIALCVASGTIFIMDALEMFKDKETCGGELYRNNMFSATLSQETNSGSSCCKHMQEIPSFGSVLPTAACSGKSHWEAMVHYSEYLLSKPSDPKQVSLINMDVFRAVYTAIQKAGDQGLSMEEVSQFVGILGENMHVHITDVLLAFGQVLKVNAFESVRIVDAKYDSKYFLTSRKQDLKEDSMTKPLERSGDDYHMLWPETHAVGTPSQKEVIMSGDGASSISVLNLPKETKYSIVQDSILKEKLISPGQNDDDLTLSAAIRMPILPWINGDATINNVVYNGLVRRVLGIVMQNPGILEADIIHQADVLNPQSCRSLLELMILDKHLVVRKMHQITSCSPPALLVSLLGNSFREPKSVYREHFFANPMSASVL